MDVTVLNEGTDKSRAAADMLSALAQLPTQLFWEVVEQSSIAITITDPKASIIYCNPAFTELTGYPRESVIGHNHSILASQQTPNERYKALWKDLTAKRPWQGRLINRRQDGGVYLAEVTISPVTDGQGRITHYLGMQQDISERYQLEQQSRNRNNLLEAVLNSAPMALALVDEQQNILLDNLAYKTLKADLKGKEPLAVLAARRNQQRKDQSADQHAEDLVWIVLNGQTRWFSLVSHDFEEVNELASQYFAAGIIPHQLVLIHDHTDREQQLQQERLEQLRRAVSDQKLMVAVRQAIEAATFKLQAPLNMLHAAQRLGNVNMDTLEVVLEEGERTLASLQARLPEPVREPAHPLSPQALLRDAVRLVEPKLDSAGIGLETVCAARLPKYTGQRVGLLTALEQALAHAIGLAALRGEEGRVRLSIRRSDEELLIDVEDNAPPPEDQAPHQLLQPLLLTDSGEPGGLSLVKEIAENHHGILEITVGALGGYCRTLRLPFDGYRENK